MIATSHTGTVFTIGHSTRAWEVFLALLNRHAIERVADIRAFPGSRRYPHFGGDRLAAALADAGIAYSHLPALGGRRRARDHAPATPWRNAGFRGFADHMTTPDFATGVTELLRLADMAPTAVMCSESVPWRCHRALVADALLARGRRVVHIMDGEARPHALTPFAAIVNGTVRYGTEPGREQLEAEL